MRLLQCLVATELRFLGELLKSFNLHRGEISIIKLPRIVSEKIGKIGA